MRDPRPCEADPDAFFPDFEVLGSKAHRAAISSAKAICEGCPFKAECFEAGKHEPHGIWGGVYRNADTTGGARNPALRYQVRSRTHCKRGHAYADSVGLRKDASLCAICRVDAKKRYQAKRTAAARQARSVA